MSYPWPNNLKFPEYQGLIPAHLVSHMPASLPHPWSQSSAFPAPLPLSREPHRSVRHGSHAVLHVEHSDYGVNMVFIEVSLGVAELVLALSAGRAASQMGSQGKHTRALALCQKMLRPLHSEHSAALNKKDPHFLLYTALEPSLILT